MAYVWKVKDKEVIIREGEPLPCVPFLVSGIVKGYCESKEMEKSMFPALVI